MFIPWDDFGHSRWGRRDRQENQQRQRRKCVCGRRNGHCHTLRTPKCPFFCWTTLGVDAVMKHGACSGGRMASNCCTQTYRLDMVKVRWVPGLSFFFSLFNQLFHFRPTGTVILLAPTIVGVISPPSIATAIATFTSLLYLTPPGTYSAFTMGIFQVSSCLSKHGGHMIPFGIALRSASKSSVKISLDTWR